MNEFIKKLIKRLEERIQGNKKYTSSPMGNDARNQIIGLKTAISIVNQLAEEYNDNIEFAQKCVELAEKMNLCDLVAENVILSHKIRFLELEAKNNNNGWIPCSERLPEKRDWYLAVFQEPDTDFILIPKVADYLMGTHTNYTTEEGWIIADCTDTETERDDYYKKLKCIAWQPIAPYQPKGD